MHSFWNWNALSCPTADPSRTAPSVSSPRTINLSNPYVTEKEQRARQKVAPPKCRSTRRDFKLWLRIGFRFGRFHGDDTVRDQQVHFIWVSRLVVEINDDLRVVHWYAALWRLHGCSSFHVLVRRGRSHRCCWEVQRIVLNDKLVLLRRWNCSVLTNFICRYDSRLRRSLEIGALRLIYTLLFRMPNFG